MNNILLQSYDIMLLIIYQIKLIVPFWIVGLALGAFLSSHKDKIIDIIIHRFKLKIGRFPQLLLAAVLGVVCPINVQGVLPIIAFLASINVNEGSIAAFLFTSVLINPNLIIYSMVLGIEVMLIRLLLCIFLGVTAGILISVFYKKKKFFNFEGFEDDTIISEKKAKITQFYYNFKKAVKKTAPNLLIGMLLTVLFEKYFPQEIFNYIFLNNRALSVLFMASLGVPLYFCGGGVIPLLKLWLDNGMSIGSAAAFMITGPATKFNNLSGIKVVTNHKNFIIYILFNIVFAVAAGTIIDFIL